MTPDIRANIRAMAGYVPGEQPRDGTYVKLNTNENPFQPSPNVMKAIRELEPEVLRRYPNPTADLFRAAAAKLWGVTPNMIIAGNGSDDILTIAPRTALPPCASTIPRTIAKPRPVPGAFRKPGCAVRLR